MEMKLAVMMKLIVECNPIRHSTCKYVY